MNIQERDSRFFGIFSLILVPIGALVPFIIMETISEWAATGFFAVSMILSLIFGIIGHKSKPGQVALYTSGSALFVAVFACLLDSF